MQPEEEVEERDTVSTRQDTIAGSTEAPPPELEHDGAGGDGEPSPQ